MTPPITNIITHYEKVRYTKMQKKTKKISYLKLLNGFCNIQLSNFRGFTYYIFKNELGITLPRTSYSQGSAGVKVEKSQLVPGDLVFFNTTGRGISHVGLYIGDGNMIHASSGKRQVRIDNINSGYYSQRYVTGRRVIN